MERRKFMIGVGSTAIGASALIGSGAFTRVEANRDVNVEVVGDSEAFLKITPADTPNGDAYAQETDGTVELNFDGDADTYGGSGISDRATWVFDDVITVKNQGTQDVAIGVDFLDSDGDTITPGAPGQVGVGGPVLRLDEGGPNYVLSTGESVDIGVFFNLDKEEDFDDVVDDLETMVIVADADEV